MKMINKLRQNKKQTTIQNVMIFLILLLLASCTTNKTGNNDSQNVEQNAFKSESALLEVEPSDSTLNADQSGDLSPAQSVEDESKSEKIGSMDIQLWDPSGVDAFADATVGNGILDFSDGCALLTLPDGFSVLIVWPKPTSWNPETQSMEYVSPQGDKVVLQDGDEIIPGGMSSDGRDLDTDCEADEVFVLSELRLVTSP